ncbi:hypothetical protein J32TS6_38840 [Virgibacillus pantothenticus]|nr:hypothetical protein J32TS6_38840 [Virgibacillus pantothenticus]
MDNTYNAVILIFVAGFFYAYFQYVSPFRTFYDVTFKNFKYKVNVSTLLCKNSDLWYVRSDCCIKQFSI